MELLLLLFAPIIIALVGLILGKGRISLKEFLIQEAVIVLIIVSGYFMARYVNTRDVELWNGKIVNKAQEKVSCSHSYSCNCRPVSCGKNCTTTHCDTCYEHSWDYDWNLYTSNQETITIDRIDRRGTKEPPRFTKARIGDPTALDHSYTNYIKANQWTILRKQGLKEKFSKYLPSYPTDIYDYHYVSRFLTPGINMKDTKIWNDQLMQLNAELGKKKKVNIVLIAVPTVDSSYIHALEEAWLGGKKNDLVVIIGVPEYPKISWVRVMSWSRAEELKIEIRDKIQEIGDMNQRDAIVLTIGDLVNEKFVKRPMSDFEYLNASARPPFWAMIILFILGIASSIGLSIFFYHNHPWD